MTETLQVELLKNRLKDAQIMLGKEIPVFIQVQGSNELLPVAAVEVDGSVHGYRIVLKT